jgi:GH25 family lysozyme M1 (1,4-beta-N-acetylmuramidase)
MSYEKEIEYNEKFSWEHGFGGGLSKNENNSFCGLNPSTVSFVKATRVFQKCEGIICDGYFGPEAFGRYKDIYGVPTLERLGYDVSGYQNPKKLSHTRMYEAGYSFVIIKANQDDRDKIARSCAVHANVAQSIAGMDFTYYAFNVPWSDFQNDAKAEAEAYLSILSKLPEGTIRITVDAENKGYKVDKNSSKVKYGQEMYDLWKGRRGGGRHEYRTRMTDWYYEYLGRLEEELDYWPILYSYPSFLRSRFVDGHNLGVCPLWLATRGSLEKPGPIGGFPNLRIHQFSSDGDARSRKVYNKDLDLNRAPFGFGDLCDSDLS